MFMLREGALFNGSKDTQRRSSLEIVANILNACRYKAGKTDLMNRCNMSFKQLTRYLDLVFGAQLASVEDDGSRFLVKISSKGKRFLDAYEGLARLTETTS
jgi:predicted transcriptional regulator